METRRLPPTWCGPTASLGTTCCTASTYDPTQSPADRRRGRPPGGRSPLENGGGHDVVYDVPPAARHLRISGARARVGGAGIQAPLTSLDPADLKKLRARAEEWGMYLEVMAPLPKEDAAAFERYAAAAKEAGAACLRTGCLGGRRYETFSALSEWQEFVARSRESIERALPVLERHRIPMGLENHKDWTIEELAPLLRQHSSP